MTRLLSSTLSSRAVSKADIETLVRSRHKSSLIVFYVRQPVAPVMILKMLNRRELATCGRSSLLKAFSNSMRLQGTGCGKTLINPHLLKIRAKHAVVVPQIPAPAAR
jgi:hypothetical protein